MARPSSTQPTEVELQILRILWTQGPSPVREIHRYLEQEKGTNYSTTVKMLAIMRDKGLVKRDESVSPHIYRAGLTQEKAQTRMLNDLIKKVYDGSAQSLGLHALSSQKASAEDIEAIRRILDDMKGE
jgi:predicted transcriptional regulator